MISAATEVELDDSGFTIGIIWDWRDGVAVGFLCRCWPVCDGRKASTPDATPDASTRSWITARFILPLERCVALNNVY